MNPLWSDSTVWVCEPDIRPPVDRFLGRPVRVCSKGYNEVVVCLYGNKSLLYGSPYRLSLLNTSVCGVLRTDCLLCRSIID